MDDRISETVTAAATSETEAWWSTLGKGLLLMAACLGLYLAGFQRYDLFTDDEIRYAEAGRRILESGDWIIPEYNGEPRYQKPILFYWLQALCQWLFGSVAWAARLPSALAGTAVVLLTVRLGRALWGPSAGWWAGIVLAVSVSPMLLSRLAFTDMVLLLCIHGAMVCFVLARLEAPSGDGCKLANAAPKQRYRLMYLGLALGTLTKGPMALALPAAVMFPWLWLRGEFKGFLRESRWREGLLILVGIAGPWYLLAHLQSGGEFTRRFFLEENLSRFTSVVNKNPQPIFFHWLLLIPLTFPWTGLLPAVVASSLRERLRNADLRTSIVWLFLWHIGLVLLMCTLSRTKVWSYTLPVFPPLALLAGRWISVRLAKAAGGGTGPRQRLPLAWILWPFFLASLALAIVAWTASPDRLPEKLQYALSHLDDPSFFLALRLAFAGLSLVSGSWLAAHYWLSARTTLLAMAGAAAGWYLLCWLIAVPALDRVWNEPVREVASELRRNPDATVITYHVHELGLNFQGRIRRVEHWREGTADEVREALAGDRPVIVLVGRRGHADVDQCRFVEWGRGTRFVYGGNYPPNLPGQGASGGSRWEK